MKISFIAFVFYLFSFLNSDFVFNMKFNFKMNPISMRCLAEYFASKTLAIFKIDSNWKDIRVRLFDPNGNAVYNKENSNSIKLSYTSADSGNHQLCIDNYSDKEVMVTFEILTGISAKDYSDVAKKENLKPVELNLQKLEDMMSYLVHELSSIMSKEKKTLTASDVISDEIVFFSMSTLVVISLIGLAEVLYLKRYWVNRKLI